MKKIQFWYDGSDEAKKALEWVNEQRALKGLAFWNPSGYFDFNCDWWDQPFPDYTLVTPTDFLREVNNQEWMPTVGEVYQFYGCGKLRKGIYKTKIGEWYVLDEDGDVATTKTMQRYHPVEEQLQSYIQDAYRTYIPSDGIQKIIEIVKGGRGDE